MANNTWENRKATERYASWATTCLKLNDNGKLAHILIYDLHDVTSAEEVVIHGPLMATYLSY